MVRYTPSQFLNLYDSYISQCNIKRQGSVELSFKRYDSKEDAKLPPTCDKAKARGDVARGEDKKENKKVKPTKDSKKGAAKPAPQPISGDSASCLVRAKFGNKKVSCVIPWSGILDFQRQFGNIFRAHTSALVPANGVSERLKKRRIASAQANKK